MYDARDLMYDISDQVPDPYFMSSVEQDELLIWVNQNWQEITTVD